MARTSRGTKYRKSGRIKKKYSKDKSLVARAALELKRVQETLLSGHSSKQRKGKSPSSRLKLPKCPPPDVTPLGKKDKKERDQLQRYCSQFCCTCAGM